MKINISHIKILSATLVIGLFLLSATACGPFSSPSPLPATPADIQPTPLSTPKPPSTAADTISSNPQPTSLTLTLWASEHVSAQTDFVAEQITRFEQAHPTTQVEWYLKKDDGQAGIINFLKSAQDVAPGVLPDVAILSTSQMPEIWRAGLIQPLDGKIDRTITQDLLPAAQQLGSIDGQLVGLPIELDVEHAIINTRLITATPMLWSDIISRNVTYAFPAKGSNGLASNATLGHYLSAGGQFADEAGNPTITPEALRQLLVWYQTMQTQSLLHPEALNLTDAAALWPDFQNGAGGLWQTNAHTFLTNRKLMPDAQPIYPPTPAGQVVSVGRSWMLVLLTNDPSRQQQALTLMESFLDAETNAAWTLRSASIPARKAAFTQLAGDDPYWAFLADALNTTVAPPTAAAFAQSSRAIQKAVEQVLTGELSPEEAVQAAQTSLSP